MTTVKTVKRYSLEEAQTIITRLKRDTFDNLNRLFKEGKAPPFDEIEGETASGMLAWNPQAPWWGKPLAMICFDNPLSRWTGKMFNTPFSEGKTGAGLNLFQNRIKPRRFPFLTRSEKAISDQNPCLTVDYNRFPGTVFSTRDELRRIDDGVFLGQAYSKLPWDKKRWLLTYFALCALGK
ncbi:MAG: hypothetical protein FJ004_12480 [Chloroflexi bacterium]|nr:hypothetical protein [Chloroflexota bacterium]